MRGQSSTDYVWQTTNECAPPPPARAAHTLWPNPDLTSRLHYYCTVDFVTLKASFFQRLRATCASGCSFCVFRFHDEYRRGISCYAATKYSPECILRQFFAYSFGSESGGIELYYLSLGPIGALFRGAFGRATALNRFFFWLHELSCLLCQAKNSIF